MTKPAFYGWYRAGDGELSAKIEYEGKTRLIEAQYLEGLKPKESDAAHLIDQLVRWFHAGVDQEDILEFMAETAEQAIIPFDIEPDSAPKVGEGIELLEITRGGSEGALAVFLVDGERRCFEASGVEALALAYPDHEDVTHWQEVAGRMREGYYLNLPNTGSSP